MSEATMSSNVRRALIGMDPRRVENHHAGPGTPDINYVLGWLELKWIRDWPRGDDTIVPIDHYTRQQRVWHRRRWATRGGMVHVLVQVGRQWIIYRGDVAAAVLGHVTRSQMIDHSACWWDGREFYREFKPWLTSEHRDRLSILYQ